MRRALLTLALLGLALSGTGQDIRHEPARTVTVITKVAPDTTTAGTSEECLYSVNIPFSNVGDVAEISYVAQHAANTNSATITVRAGQSTCTGSTSMGANAGTTSGQLHAGFFRCTMVTTAIVSCLRNNLFLAAENGSPAQITLSSLTLPGNVLVGITGTTGVQAGDITLRTVQIFLYR